MTADLAQRLRDWAGAVAHRDLEAGLREAADAIDYAVRAADVNDRALDSLTAERDAEIRLSGSRLRHLNEAEARLAAAELHLFSGHGCDCRHMAERKAAYLGTEKAYSSEQSLTTSSKVGEGPDDLDAYLERRKAAAHSEKDDGWSKIEGVRWRNPNLNFSEDKYGCFHDPLRPHTGDCWVRCSDGVLRPADQVERFENTQFSKPD